MSTRTRTLAEGGEVRGRRERKDREQEKAGAYEKAGWQPREIELELDTVLAKSQRSARDNNVAVAVQPPTLIAPFSLFFSGVPIPISRFPRFSFFGRSMAVKV